jgi:rRNA-processing protein FCF1
MAAVGTLLRGLSRRLVVVDTNILLLLVVGSNDLNELERHKRTRSLAVDRDLWHALLEVLAHFATVAVTPTILAETSNLLGRSTELRAVLAALLRQWIEVYHASEEIMRRHGEAYLRLGLTDVAILKLAEEGAVVLTDDALLHREILQWGHRSVNLNHLRST